MILGGKNPTTPAQVNQRIAEKGAENLHGQAYAGETAVANTVEIDVTVQPTPAVEIPVQHEPAPVAASEK